MSLLLSTDALAERRDTVAGPLRPLAESLAADLEPLLARDLYVPEQKALLSRDGGRCAIDGTMLAFDPFEPEHHRCPRCGREYRGELHHRFWIYWYQLWLAERGVHAAVLHRLGGDRRFAELAKAILQAYVDRYATYPNVDNVLGPTRLFFSTYLESIWLLQIVIAADLLDEHDPKLVARVRDRIVEPSRTLVAEYDEAGSNRQVWNAAALLGAARLLGDQRAAERVVFGESGVVEQLSTGLLADGTWYEGENYHLFAHRGLWYGVTLAEEGGFEIPVALVDRFQRGFATPFLTALPDFTLPSRRDSQYAISLRQWRIAEHVELGLARRNDPALRGALHRVYRDDIPRRETNRRTSSADAERNDVASSLTRADLSWRALLRGLPVLPPLEAIAPHSVLLDRQGIAVFRRNEGRTYVALDYGHSGGGHGHPDRLNLLLADGLTRWLDDAGTGSYVDPSLHWYRSTLAHNAPLVGGKSQPARDGDLVTYEERGGAGWISASAEIGFGARAERTVVVLEQYLIDRLVWRAERETTFDLPLHSDVLLERGSAPPQRAELEGGAGLEDGFRFVDATEVQHVDAGVTVEGRAEHESGDSLRLWSKSDLPADWWRGVAPGPPGAGDRAFRLIRAHGTRGELVTVLAWSPDVTGVEIGDAVHVSLADGTRHVHRRDSAGWHIELSTATARSSIDLGSVLRVESGARKAPPVVAARTPLVLRTNETVSLALGEPHYRRSEESWSDAGRPSASVALRRNGAGLTITVLVERSDLNFAPRDAPNRYDNEHRDINGDGVELFVKTDAGLTGWMLVPDPEPTLVRTRTIDGWTAERAVSAWWSREGGGYVMVIELDVVPLALDVIVNEMPRGRQRRRGQLVASGARGEFVYLRGDRHDASRLMPIQVADG